MAGPNLPDIQTLIQMGINPKTGLPMKFGSRRIDTKDDIKKAIRKNDRQIAANRFTWKNLPKNLSSQELEKNLYYWGSLAFWYCPELDEFYFSKYALDGKGLDFYGRYLQIHPIPINSGGSDAKYVKAQEAVLSRYRLDVQYGEVENPEEVKNHSAVILRDYTNGLPQMDIPTQVVHESVIDLEAECMPFLRTALLNSTGTMGVRVADADQEDAVKQAAIGMVDAATHAEPYVPIVGMAEFQELTNGKASGKSQEFLQAMQAIDNFRLGLFGCPNGGLFEKNQYVNNKQTDMNVGSTDVSLVLQDGLELRKRFCEIVNSLWNLNMSCEISKNIVNSEEPEDEVADNAVEEGETEDGNQNV